MSHIKFGTSGWRGIFCEEFTLENVRVVIQAIADHLHAEGLAERGIVIGYDARFMGADFSRETARVLAGAGIKSYFCERDTPTPVIAHEILRRKAAGGINFTASHNPYNYNGIKFSPVTGGPALPATTNDIEKRANAMIGEIVFKDMDLKTAAEKGLFEEIDPREEYFKTLKNLINFKAIADAGMTIAVNPLYGSGRGYLDRILEETGVKVVKINDHLDPYFGGNPPEPAEEYIQDFIGLIKGNDSIVLGLGTDGDADRFGIIDADGSYIEPNYILALLFDYMIRQKGLRGDAARSVATSHLIDAVAAHHGVKVLETPVGFKFIGEYISEDKILIGGEESAGLSIKGHVPEKDGILACLLVAEMVAVEKKSLRELLADLYSRVGEIYTKRINIHLSPQLEAGLPDKFANPPEKIGELKIVEVIRIDGNKYLLEDGSWLLFRKSGTEPVVRLYAETKRFDSLAKLIDLGREFILGL
ncbi:MAG: phosphoglucomutase/phosphomannomutase family protein [Desulfuromusa sp.]|jgi:alpha-D-glucose phosphate-specific phosphoglucomutase|nr:phosphoglucomutase/phosphomannomutase family protein [Desulfuromusa sp.]